MSDWSTLETALFFAIVVPISIICLLILILKRKQYSRSDMIVCGGAIATLLCTYLPWYRVEFINFSLWDTYSSTAFIILGAGVAALAIVTMRALLFGRSADLGSQGPILEGIVILAASGLALFLTLVRWFRIPTMKVEVGMTFEYVRAWGLTVALIAGVIFLVGSMMKLVEKR